MNYRLEKWIETTEKGPWIIKNPDCTPCAKAEFYVEINTENKKQNFTGMGGCLNEAGGKTLFSLGEEKENEILIQLFDSAEGCGLSYCRLPIGANDYSIDWYSLNDTPYDFEMEHFSVERDEEVIIPYIMKALKINPDIRFWASPWSPPAWMKKNNHYACTSSRKYNDLTEDKQGEEMKTLFLMEPDFLTAYAKYFVKYIEEYEKRGINISAVHIQNEPNSCQIFPSCVWAPEDLGLFIAEYLGPEFSKNNIAAKIWLGTIERREIDRVKPILENKKAMEYIKGIGVQWQGRELLPLLNRDYPFVQTIQTETECGDGSNDWRAMEYTFSLMKDYFSNGVSSYMCWNMILPEDGTSRWGWKQNSLISVDPENKVIYNPEFYLMKHLGAFAGEGFRYLPARGDYLNTIAFAGDEEVVLLLLNYFPENICLKVCINQESHRLEIKKKSINTLIYKIKKGIE